MGYGRDKLRLRGSITANNKLTSVFSLCVCPVIDDKLRHNIVKVAAQITRELFPQQTNNNVMREIYHQ